MAVPKRKKSKNKACVRLNYLKYKFVTLQYYNTALIKKHYLNKNNIIKKTKLYLI